MKCNKIAKFSFDGRKIKIKLKMRNTAYTTYYNYQIFL